MPVLRQSDVKAILREHGKRSSADFMGALEYVLRQRVVALAQVHNGGRKTLDAAAVHAFFGNPSAQSSAKPKR